MASTSSFVSPGRPYLHSSAYNFRSDVKLQVVNRGYGLEFVKEELIDAISKLSSMADSLRAQAEVFLAPWGGDYRAASVDIFGGLKEGEQEGFQECRRIANEILNSRSFHQCIIDNSKFDIKKVETALADTQLKEVINILQTQRNGTIEEIAAAIANQIWKNVKGKRVMVNENEIIFKLINATHQKYMRDIDSLKKRLTKALKKAGSQPDWQKIFQWFSMQFSKKMKDKALAEEFLIQIKNDFISQGKKLKHVDYSNISGFIGENLEVAIINNSTMSVTMYDVGELDEKELLVYANEIESSINKFSPKQIQMMGHKNSKGQQSGSDWVIANKYGTVVRAQVKNSTALMEELREHGKVNRPQPIKLQDEISYQTLKSKLQAYDKGSGLSDEDWSFLDYLIANTLWIRAGGAVTKNKGADYGSGVSGIQQLINRLLTKEIGYFLGVSIDVDSKEQAVQTIVGGSNVFFILDNAILYPTWLLIRNICKQLMGLEQGLAKLYVTLGSYNRPSRSAMEKEKEIAKQKNPDWQNGQPYGSALLEVGQNYGENIINSLNIGRINLNINIDAILQQLFEIPLS